MLSRIPKSDRTNTMRHLLFLAALASVSASAQSPEAVLSLEPGFDQYDGSGFGWRIETLDLDEDGTDEILVSAVEGLNSLGMQGAGRVYLYDGASLTLRFAIESPNPNPNGFFGQDVCFLPDVNEDGVADIAVSSGEEDAYPDGVIYVFSGQDGSLLTTLEPPPDEDFRIFGFSMVGAEDLNGDGFGELVVGSPLSPGSLYVYSGADWSVLAVFEGGNDFGAQLAPYRDVDLDGHDEILVGESGRVYALSLMDGERLITAEPLPGQGFDGFGEWDLVQGPDANGDGAADILIVARRGSPQVGPINTGLVYLVSGTDGEVIHTLSLPSALYPGGTSLLYSVNTVPDIDGDGIDDIVSGWFEGPGICFPPNPCGEPPLEVVITYSSATGDVLSILDAEGTPAGTGGGVFGLRLAQWTGPSGVKMLLSHIADGSPYGGVVYVYDPDAFLPVVGNETLADERSAGPLSIEVMPNPTRGLLQLNIGSVDGMVDINLHDSSGRRILEQSAVPAGSGGVLQLDLTPYPPGIYLVRIRDGQRSATARVTKLP